MQNATSPILQVRNLGKQITLHILGGAIIEPFADVSFAVAEGEFVAIAGPSGSGKSSVIKALHRTYLATSGSANYTTAAGEVVDLASISDRRILELRRKEIGFVSQFLKVEPRVPAIDIIARPLMRRGVDETVARSRAAGLLQRLDVPERLWHSYPALFSGGEQQRINIARALIGEPRLLLGRGICGPRDQAAYVEPHVPSLRSGAKVAAAAREKTSRSRSVSEDRPPRA